jgi:hypothetical protein
LGFSLPSSGRWPAWRMGGKTPSLVGLLAFMIEGPVPDDPNPPPTWPMSLLSPKEEKVISRMKNVSRLVTVSVNEIIHRGAPGSPPSSSG